MCAYISSLALSSGMSVWAANSSFWSQQSSSLTHSAESLLSACNTATKNINNISKAHCVAKLVVIVRKSQQYTAGNSQHKMYCKSATDRMRCVHTGEQREIRWRVSNRWKRKKTRPFVRPFYEVVTVRPSVRPSSSSLPSAHKQSSKRLISLNCLRIGSSVVASVYLIVRALQ